MTPNFKELIKNPIHFFAFGFGSGLAPKAPGTFGTIVAIPIYLLLVHFLNLNAYLVVVVAISVVGIWLCGRTAHDLGVHDHKGIVWDEIAGYLIAITALAPTWTNILLAFLLFRLFDIWKPWPIRWLDKHIGGGLGIMLDDIVAGILACGILHLAYYLI